MENWSLYKDGYFAFKSLWGLFSLLISVNAGTTALREDEWKIHAFCSCAVLLLCGSWAEWCHGHGTGIPCTQHFSSRCSKHASCCTRVHGCKGVIEALVHVAAFVSPEDTSSWSTHTRIAGKYLPRCLVCITAVSKREYWYGSSINGCVI